MQVTKFKTLLGCGALSLLMWSTPPPAHAEEKPVTTPVLAVPFASQNALEWTEWDLTSPDYAGLEKRPILRFTDSQINASVGLNSIFGGYDAGKQKLKVKALASTMMAGPQPLMKAETQYSKALEGAQSFELSKNGEKLTVRGAQTLVFRLTARTAQGFVAKESKIINVSPQLGPEMDGDKNPIYLQLEDLSTDISWGRFTEAKIEGFNFVPGFRYQLRVVIERNNRDGEKRLRLLEIFSQQWMRTAQLGASDKIFEVAPTKVDCVGVGKMKCLQVREAGGKWMNFHSPIEGFDFQEGWRYRLQVAVAKVNNPPADGSSLRYSLVRILDKMPVTY